MAVVRGTTGLGEAEVAALLRETAGRGVSVLAHIADDSQFECPLGGDVVACQQEFAGDGVDGTVLGAEPAADALLRIDVVGDHFAEQLIDGAPEAITILDVKARRFAEANPQACKLLGFDPAEKGTDEPAPSHYLLEVAQELAAV